MNSKKKTKIVATISDRRCDVEFLTNLYYAGMNVVRLNTAHQTVEEAKKVIDNVRRVSDQIAVLVDTKGPEMRTSPMKNDDGFDVNHGDIVIISGDSAELSSEERLYINYPNFVHDVPIGATILIDDGEIALQVTDKTEDYILSTVMNAGKIKGRKSVNVPSVHVKLPSLSEKDIDFICWAVDNEVDFIAHSFVRNAQDVADVQKILDEKQSHIKIIAKIENQQGVDNIDEILGHVYGIMVARGDLGVEIDAEKIPVIQRMLIHKCRERKKPVIIATQMLHTMIEHPRPTRAEVSDVANAIYQRTDAIMLSGETASGMYPLESVETMSKIAMEIEQNLQPETDIQLNHVTKEVTATLARSAVEATMKLPVKAIVIDTMSGRTGRYLAVFRPSVPVFAKCYKSHSMRELALSYGVYASMMAPRNSKDEFEHEAISALLIDKLIELKDQVAVIGGSFGPTAGATFMEICPAATIVQNDKI
ncbi:MAG: pyruvate kinase [Prevotellaceae bacterium]|jgi:pyruvate kinase|nr:pyruvate kinase [Prevotellaceae bacterium]